MYCCGGTKQADAISKDFLLCSVDHNNAQTNGKMFFEKCLKISNKAAIIKKFFDVITKSTRLMLWPNQLGGSNTQELVKMETQDNSWNVCSIFEFTTTYFCCPECYCKLENKQDFINHASNNHEWVSAFFSAASTLAC